MITRDAERERIKRLIAEIEAAGITIYKISLMCHRQFNSVKHWKITGRVESYDAQMLEAIHSEYCKVLTISATQEQATAL